VSDGGKYNSDPEEGIFGDAIMIAATGFVERQGSKDNGGGKGCIISIITD